MALCSFILSGFSEGRMAKANGFVTVKKRSFPEVVDLSNSQKKRRKNRVILNPLLKCAHFVLTVDQRKFCTK